MAAGVARTPDYNSVCPSAQALSAGAASATPAVGDAAGDESTAAAAAAAATLPAMSATIAAAAHLSTAEAGGIRRSAAATQHSASLSRAGRRVLV